MEVTPYRLEIGGYKMEKSGMFKDFNFKLIVIEALLDKDPLFLEELTNLADKYTEAFEWYTGAGPIPEIKDYLEKLNLEISDLSKINSLYFDGGHEIYHILKPDWDGEDSLFDVQSVEGFQNLINLKTVDYISLCDPIVLEPFKLAGIKVE
jgi:hypothetical protein